MSNGLSVLLLFLRLVALEEVGDAFVERSLYSDQSLVFLHLKSRWREGGNEGRRGGKEGREEGRVEEGRIR